MLLMKEAKYRPFVNSGAYRKLYRDAISSYKANIEANPANRKLIIESATAYSKSKRD
jgi:hypothetical protein